MLTPKVSTTLLRPSQSRHTSFPKTEPCSKRYRDLFNRVSEELRMGISWSPENQGHPHPLRRIGKQVFAKIDSLLPAGLSKQILKYTAAPNHSDPLTPRLETKELELHEPERYGYRPGQKRPTGWTPTLLTAVQTIRETIEARRQEVARAAYEQFTLIPSPSLEKLKQSKPVEREWINLVSTPLIKIANQICGKQEHPRFEAIWEWVQQNSDPYSKAHFTRILSDTIPYIRPRFEPAIPAYQDYMSSLPWLPKDCPTYNAMWPEDLTPQELDYFVKRLPKDHPILSVHTVVDRVSEAEAISVLLHPKKNQQGEPIEWVTQGLGGKWFKTTNLAFHPRFREDFLAAADVIEQYADIDVAGEQLHSSFRDYLKTVATCLRAGDFTKQLAADLEQVDGNLFFSFFQHEGYWEDGIKFPLSFEIGIRDQALIEKAKRYAWVFAAIEDRNREIAKELGLALPEGTPLSIEAFPKTVQFVWLVRSAGNLRSSASAEVAGHDYPKVHYDGIKHHRNVILLDVLSVTPPYIPGMRETLMQPEDAGKITVAANQFFTLLHERGHELVGNRPDSPTLAGPPLGYLFGNYWGSFAEPHSDLTALYAAPLLHEHGDITDQELEEVVDFAAWHKLASLIPHEEALQETFIQENPHFIGSIWLFGSLFGKGLAWDHGQEKLVIHPEIYLPSARALFEHITRFSLLGDKEGYLAFLRENIQKIPEEIIQKVRDVKIKQGGAFLVDRGDLSLQKPVSV